MTSILAAVVLVVGMLPGASATQRRDEDAEFREIVALLELTAGESVADVGAGGGQWTFRFADHVGPSGRVLSTEVRPINVDAIRNSAKKRGLANITAILGTQDDIGLPADCCDALLLRLVYHAFDVPQKMRDGLQQAMKPGGLVVIVDFRPTMDQLGAEMKTAGFEQVRRIDRWQGQDSVYAVVFRRTR